MYLCQNIEFCRNGIGGRACPEPHAFKPARRPTVEGGTAFRSRSGKGGTLNGQEALKRENEALRERISRLSVAVLRVSTSLDLTTVLHEAVECVCTLTGARCGVITTLDDSGQPEDFVTSGFTEEERLQLPDVHSLCDTADLMGSKTFQRTPMHHRGRHMGDFFLAGKDNGREFTQDGQEALVLFASQAAAAIANARTHRDERRARADLEALVYTSPVGVVVFDARTAEPVLLNREAQRIVESLCKPDRTPGGLAGGADVPVFRWPRDRTRTSSRWHGSCKAPRRCWPRKSCSRCLTAARSRR